MNPRKCAILCAMLMLGLAGASAGADARADAKSILAATGFRGGLIVHLGCGGGTLTAALRASESIVVHGLEADAALVAKARSHIASLGLYGPVSVARWDGKRLPYGENFVSLLVAEDLRGVPMAEVERVLAPLGVAYVRHNGQWTKTAKPWPKELDEWTHWMHDAGNNAMAADTRVGPPRRMQWVARPLWSRGHEVISSVGACVSARGRIFYALDEGQPGVYTLPSRWTLVARDAFNGVLLWKRPLPHWNPPVSLGGFGRGFRPERLATDGERVFLALGQDAVLTALDAATGRTLKALDGARGTTKVLCADGLLVVLAAWQGKSGADARRGQAQPPTLVAARPDTLEVLWTAPARGLARSTLALAPGRVVFKAGNAIVALDRATGKESWRTPWTEPKPTGRRRRSATALVVRGQTVHILGGGRLAALAASTGKMLWQRKDSGGGRGGLFVAPDLVWRAKGSTMAGHDPATGEVKTTRNAAAVFSRGHHPRCYPPKATERYIITPNRGAEFVSLTSDEHVGNDWVRGNCGHGVMPANGLLYAPPCQCFCYSGVMLTGFKALAAEGDEGRGSEVEGRGDEQARLERGPAYSAIQNRKSQITNAHDWPMYRHGPGRLGSTAAVVPAAVKPVWTAKLGGRLTPPVVAGGLLVVARSDAHSVHAFGAADGRPRWSFIAGGRVDSPPTLHEGLVLFGCADGWVYCLQASDGQLAWRLQAAPADRRVGAFGQLESAWPAHGSVLVLDGVAYLTAGRSTHLDGGIHAYGLDPRSGRVVHHARLEGAAGAPKPPADKPEFVPAFHVEGARSDLLVSDGTAIYMGPLKLDKSLARLPTPYIVPAEGKTLGSDLTAAPYVDTGIFKMGLEKRRKTDFPSLGVLRGPMGDKQMGLHLVATGGFLDASWFNRTYWMYAAIWPGYYIAHLSAKAGQLLAVDATTTYGVQAYPSRTIHSPTFKPATKGYLLFADANTNEPVLDDRARGRDKGMGFTRSAPPRWFHWLPLRIRAMVAAGPTLFVAGPPDAMDPKAPYAAIEGRQGAALCAFATKDGEKLGELKLDSDPVFDGLIAAGGRLFIATRDGHVACLGGEEK